MSRAGTMLERLPAPYAIDEGSVIEQLLRTIALQLQIFDQDLDRVQRSHWVDHAFNRSDLAKLGSLFQIDVAGWEPTRVYRARLKATIAAMLRGSVTVDQLDQVLNAILLAARGALGTDFARPRRADDSGRTSIPFVEFPERLKRSSDLVDRGGLVRPLESFVVTNGGIDPTPLGFALTGVSGSRTANPLLVNRTNGSAIGFRGVIQAGQRLVVKTTVDRTIDARLEGEDVTPSMLSLQHFASGPGRPDLTPDAELSPVTIDRGNNDIWLISVARYDDPGLDAAMFAVASDALHQGIFGDGKWGSAVFYQEPVAGLDAWWNERTPASFRFDVPAGVVVRDPDRRTEPEDDRAELFRLMRRSVDQLRAAGVVGEVAEARLTDTQHSFDRAVVLSPISTTEEASAGEESIVGISAQFDEVPRDRARFE